MENFRPFTNGVLSRLLFIATLVHIPFLFAQKISPITVEESTSSTSAAPRTEPFIPPIEKYSEDAIEDQYQIQILQHEVMQLRGLVEEFTYRLNRMRDTQDKRYLELDARFQGMDAKLNNLSLPAKPAPVDVAPVTVVPNAVDIQDEKTLYDTAQELIRNRQFDLAISQLKAVITQHPDGAYTPNAYYWLGEVYIAKLDPDLEGARQALEQVIQFFPEHRKVPDAAFKLGQVYNLMGDCVRARDLLEQVVELHQGKSVATLSESYLRDKVSCEVD